MGTQGWASENVNKFNYENQSLEGPPPLDDGYYNGKIVSAEPVKSKSGNPAVKYVVQVDSAFDGSEVSPARKFTTTTAVTEKAMGIVYRLAKCAGDVDPPEDDSYDTLFQFCKSLLRQNVVIRTKKEPYQGKVSSRLDRMVTPEEAEDATSGKDQAAE